MNKLGVFSAFLLIFSCFCYAGDIESIGKELKQPPVFSATFVQKKKMKILSKPLVSSGKLWVDEDKGVVWLTENPIQSRVVISKQGVTFSDSQSNRTVKSMKFIAGVLQGVLSGNLKAIDEQFLVLKIDVSEDKEKWVVELQPRSLVMRKGVSSITMKGGHYVETIILNEASGDKTDIVLQDVNVLKSLPVELSRVFIRE